jgi:hypothetical protein
MDARKVRQLRQGVNEVLRSSNTLSPTQQETLRNYYGNAIFRAMTQPAALDEPSRFPDWRSEIVRDLYILRGRDAAHSFLRKLVLDSTKVLAAENPNGNFHPACRYNALLIMGELNETEPDRDGSRRIPEIPYAPVRPVLLNVLSSNQSDELQIAALIGLQRHAKLLALAGQADRAVGSAMVKIIQTKQPAAGASLDAHHWKQRICVETLGLIGQGAEAAYLEPIVLDDNLPLSLRCAAAQALGQLDYGDSQQVNAGPLLKGLGKVALSACQDEIQRITDYSTANSSSAGQPRTAPGGIGGAPAGPVEDPVVRMSRRNLKHRLRCVRQGLEGVERVATAAEQKNTVTAMKAEVESILTGLDDNPASMTPADLLNRIRSPSTRLKQVVDAAA